MKIPRTFHIPTIQATTLNIKELDDRVCISIENNEVYLTRDQFEAFCELRYEIKWDHSTE